jgi:RimJ/RimL family protein N-acetyltransferase
MRTTERLVLRPFRDEDLPHWAELNTDPEVMRFLGGEPLSRAESDGIAEAVNRQYVAEGIGFLAIERRSDGAFLGAGGLTHEAWYPDEIDIGRRLARGMTFDHAAELVEDGVPFDAVLYSITSSTLTTR